MTWQPTSFKPVDQNSATITSLFGGDIPAGNFDQTLMQQPWQPSTFKAVQPVVSPATPAVADDTNQLSQIIDKRGAQGWDAINNYKNDKLSLPETALQVLGKSGAGTIGDVIGAGVSDAFGALPQSVQQPVKSALSYVGKEISSVTQPIAKGYDALQQAFPRATKDVESAVNLASMLPIGVMIGEARKPVGSALQYAGDATYASGVKSAAASKSKFVQDLITPKETPTVANDLFSRSSEKGILRNRVVEPTAQEQAVIDTVSQLPVSRGKSLLANHNIIEYAKNAEAQNLMGLLKKNNVAVSSQEVATTLDAAKQRLANSPFITGDGETAANKVIQGAIEQIKNNSQDATGLLQARKDFDSWLIKQRPSIFDAKSEGAVNAAVREVRQGINDLIDQKVPAAGVRESLTKQSNLYRAMDNIQTKGGSEGKNIVTRAMQKGAKAIPVKGALAKAAVATGIAGGAVAAPLVTTGALAAYGTKKAITSPTLRKAIGKTLSTTGKIIK